MTLWSDLKKHRVICYRGDKIIQKKFEEGVLYTNARGWMTSRIFVQELKRFSKFLEKARPNKKCLLWLAKASKSGFSNSHKPLLYIISSDSEPKF